MLFLCWGSSSEFVSVPPLPNIVSEADEVVTRDTPLVRNLQDDWRQKTHNNTTTQQGEEEEEEEEKNVVVFLPFCSIAYDYISILFYLFYYGMMSV